jgi:hypothetical protein
VIAEEGELRFLLLRGGGRDKKLSRKTRGKGFLVGILGED